MTSEHKECQRKLLEIGGILGFKVDRGERLGKMYHMGAPDCVWYYDCKGKELLMKIVEGDRCKFKEVIENGKVIKKKCNKHGSVQYLPLVAFEVPSSEKEKALRGSLMSLQLANASASIIVLIGKSAKEHTLFVNRLKGRYSYMRIRVWTEDDINKLYNSVTSAKQNQSQISMVVPSGKKLEVNLKAKYNTVVGELTLKELKQKIEGLFETKIKISGRSLETGKQVTISIPIKDIL